MEKIEFPRRIKAQISVLETQTGKKNGKSKNIKARKLLCGEINPVFNIGSLFLLLAVHRLFVLWLDYKCVISAC